MRKLLTNLGFISSLLLTGCASENRLALPDISLPDIKIPGVYTIPVQQGNLITQEMVNELKPGMTRKQVRYLLGTPLLVDTFHDNRWDYLYTNKPGSESILGSSKTEQKRLRLHFKNNRLHKIVGDIYPQGEALAKITRDKSNERTIVIPPGTPKYDENLGFFDRMWGKVTTLTDPEPERRDTDGGTGGHSH